MDVKKLFIVSILSFLNCLSMHLPVQQQGEREKRPEVLQELQNYHYEQAYTVLHSLDVHIHDIHCIDPDKGSPLHYYAFGSPSFLVHYEDEKDKRQKARLITPSLFTSLLLKKGAQLEAIDIYGHTPLLAAGLGGNIYMAWLLIQCGANYHAVSAQKQNLLHLLFSSKQCVTKMNTFIKKGYEVPWLKKIIAVMSDAGEVASLKWQCLKMLVRDDNKDFKKLPRDLQCAWWCFMRQYATIFYADQWRAQELDPLFYAEVYTELQNKTLPVAELLSSEDQHGKTPLNYAFESHAHPFLIELLIQAGSNRLLYSNKNKTAAFIRKVCECKFAYSPAYQALLERYLQTAHTIMAFVEQEKRKKVIDADVH